MSDPGDQAKIGLCCGRRYCNYVSRKRVVPFLWRKGVIEMSKLTMFLSCVAVLTIAVGLSGCGDKKKPVKPKPDEHAGHDHAKNAHPSPKVEKAMAELSAEDRAAAERQRICPVSGGPLGSMGKPYKVQVKGRDVFLCCKGCEDAIKKDPDKFLAKLDK